MQFFQEAALFYEGWMKILIFWLADTDTYDIANANWKAKEASAFKKLVTWNWM